MERNAKLWVLLALALVVGGLYGATLMVSVSGCAPVKYCTDVGEFQVALSEWGTVHPTGYPLYMLLGSPFVAALRALGVPPSAGSSVYSLVWQVLAIAGVYLLLHRETGNPWLSGAAALVLAVTRSMWVHGSIAEVYALSMALTIGILWLAVRAHDRWTDAGGWTLAFVGGLGVAHHRLLAVLLPAVGLYVLPAAWRSRRFWRWLVVACLCALAGFLPYLDIPLRVWRGSTWLYSRADTWAEFWRIFRGAEYALLQRPRLALPTVWSTAGTVWTVLRDEMGRAGILLGLAGAALALVRVPRRAALWWGVGLSYLAFALVMAKAVMVQADLMPVLMCLVVACALGIAQLPRRWQMAAGGLLLAGGCYLAATQVPVVRAWTRNDAGERYVAQMEKLEAPPGAVVMALWGQSYFNLSYAQRAEGRLGQRQLVDHRADFQALAAQADGRVYMSADMPYLFSPDRWRRSLGTPLRLTSAGLGLLAVTAQPLPAPAGPIYEIGDGVALAGWDVRQEPGGMDVVLEWAALHPASADYSTFVYATDQAEIAGPDDLISQHDSSAPVYGWYPTSQWQVGEVVREDHWIPLAGDRVPRTLFVGMYRNVDGRFVTLGQVALDASDQGWRARNGEE